MGKPNPGVEKFADDTVQGLWFREYLLRFKV